jgi:hypothetical protein
MEENRTHAGRRGFLQIASAAVLAGIALTVLGCGDDKGTGPDAGGTAGTGDKNGEISNNHGHKAVLTKAQLDAGEAVVLHIQGDAAHDHTLSFSADDMAKLKNGGMVTVESSAGGTGPHTHSVMFM